MDQIKGKKYKSLSKRTILCGKCSKLIERIESLQAHFNTFHDGEGAYEKGQSKLSFSNVKSRKRTHEGNPPEEELAHLSEDTDESSDIIQRPSSAPILNLMTEDSLFPNQMVRPESAPPDNNQFTTIKSSSIPGPSSQSFGPVTPPAVGSYGQQSAGINYFILNNKYNYKNYIFTLFT